MKLLTADLATVQGDRHSATVLPGRSSHWHIKHASSVIAAGVTSSHRGRDQQTAGRVPALAHEAHVHSLYCHDVAMLTIRDLPACVLSDRLGSASSVTHRQVTLCSSMQISRPSMRRCMAEC